MPFTRYVLVGLLVISGSVAVHYFRYEVIQAEAKLGTIVWDRIGHRVCIASHPFNVSFNGIQCSLTDFQNALNELKYKELGRLSKFPFARKIFDAGFSVVEIEEVFKETRKKAHAAGCKKHEIEKALLSEDFKDDEWDC